MPDALGRLRAAVGRYLRGLDGPGVAEVLAGIRAHDRRDRNAAAAPPPVRFRRLLDDALADLRTDGRDALARAMDAAAPQLCWVSYDGYPTEAIGPAFARGHLFASLIGLGAPWPARDFDFGLFLIAPGLFYRDHAHAAPELYAPLTGPHGWRFAPGAAFEALPAHVPVWNIPHRPHATLVGRRPFLSLYAWTRDANAPAYLVPAPDWAEIEGEGSARA